MLTERKPKNIIYETIKARKTGESKIGKYGRREKKSAEAIADDIVMTIRGFIFEWIVRYPDMDLNACLQKHFKTYLAGL